MANQKGGVAKTTTVHSLGVASAEFGRRTLVIDLDPQACLTYSLGFDPDRLDGSLHDVFVRRVPVAEVARPVPGVPGLDVLPATIDLAGSEVHLLTRTGREHVLERALEPVVERYDLVLVDCPPSLGVLTINGLTAADAVLIPLQCEALSHRGVGQLLETIEDVRAFANSSIRVRGIVVTMFDDRTRHALPHPRRGRDPLRNPGPPAAGAEVHPLRGGTGPWQVDHPACAQFAGSTRLSRARARAHRDGRAGRHHSVVPEGPDPLGKRALFWLPLDAEAGTTADTPTTSTQRADGGTEVLRRHARPAGKRALYSSATPAGEAVRATSSATAADPVPQRGLLTVACSSCGAVTRIGLVGFLMLQFPIAAWLPRREFDRWMTCPACHKRTWTSVTCSR